MPVVEGKADTVEAKALEELSIGIGEEVLEELEVGCQSGIQSLTVIGSPCRRRAQTFPRQWYQPRFHGSGAHTQGNLR